MSCQITMPKKVFSGAGSISKLPEILKECEAGRVAVFTYPGVTETGLLSLVADQLSESRVEYCVIDDLAVEPTIAQAKETMSKFEGFGADAIVALGGGSVMDVAKLASMLAGSSYELEDLVKTPSLGRKMLPTIMIPTTAGTGAEATPNSIVTDAEKQLKIGIVNEAMIGDYIILEPAMIRNIPRAIAASTGIDALAHAIECYTSKKATPLSDLYALEAMKLIFKYIEAACEPEQRNDEALSAMMLAAYYGGMAITGSGTTAVHALSYPLGGRYHIPHGVANAILLEPVMRFNKEACAERLAQVYDAVYPQQPIPEEEKAERMIERLSEIVKKLGIPTSLSEFGVDSRDLEDLVQAGMEVTRLLSNNRKPVTAEDARALYQQILQ